MYGKYFNTRRELKEFVENIYPDAEVDYEGIFEVPVLEDIEIECLDAYEGTKLLLGYTIKLGETLDAYREKWNKAFPGVTATAHLSVKIS